MSTEDQAGRPRDTAPMTPHGAARRRLAKAGLGAASVLWTTQSHAMDFKCMSASAALSGSLSSNKEDQLMACQGRSPGYWKNHGGWPVPTSTLFGEVFSCSDRTAGTYGSATLLALLNKCDFDKSKLGMHMTAAYLNVKSGKIGFLSERTLRQMWYQLQTSGHYEPAGGVFWDLETTKQYLESTYKGKRD